MRYSRFDNSFMFFSLIYLSIYLPYVLGHGFVLSTTVGTHTYPGWNPFADPTNPSIPPRVVRKVGPIDGFVERGDVDMACHHGGNEGTIALANATDGSNITFHWTNWPGDHKGPVSTYMTLCVGGCSKFGANAALWFKIHAEGYNPSPTDKDEPKWASDKLIRNNNSWTSTIPAGLRPGEYLVRNEIVAMHSAGKPQFYPSCSQINVIGSGTHFPSSRDMVSMQDLYNGVVFSNIDYNFSSFTIPGPPPVNFKENGGQVTSTSTTKSQPSSRPLQQCQLGLKLRRRISG